MLDQYRTVDDDYIKAVIFNDKGQNHLAALIVKKAVNGIVNLNSYKEFDDLDVIGLIGTLLCDNSPVSAFDTFILPKNAKAITSYALYGMVADEIVWPSACLEIPHHAFECCKTRKISNMDNVQTIGEEAFIRSSIESITLPKNISQIPKGCFSSCKQLTEVNGMEHIKAIGESAFRDCISLSQISLSNVFSIGDYAFRHTNIQRVDLTDSVCHTIGRKAFADTNAQEYRPGNFLRNVDITAFANTPLLA